MEILSHEELEKVKGGYFGGMEFSECFTVGFPYKARFFREKRM